jgi:hypothetical protein
MARFVFDLRFALRSLDRSPLFTLVAVASLALGIGANTAIFTLIDQLMLRLLPVAQPEQLVMIWSTGPHMGSNRGSRMASYPMFQDFQKKAQAFSSVFCRRDPPVSLSSSGQTGAPTRSSAPAISSRRSACAPPWDASSLPKRMIASTKGTPPSC